MEPHSPIPYWRQPVPRRRDKDRCRTQSIPTPPQSRSDNGRLSLGHPALTEAVKDNMICSSVRRQPT
ncbi:hypothetical protein D779_3905 [Imhoffiella purpurea]|uniref:Uncharacterized protein n=1 Tax=Imhoffiella purpurea TaxID=1249627 RepID=W9V1Z4_9GAMM|nr:hypothetical protein D779_3905 [Imhoffiella purpurea]